MLGRRPPNKTVFSSVYAGVLLLLPSTAALGDLIFGNKTRGWCAWRQHYARPATASDTAVRAGLWCSIGFRHLPHPLVLLFCCRVELISWQPRALVLHGFLADAECDHIIRVRLRVPASGRHKSATFGRLKSFLLLGYACLSVLLHTLL